MHTTEAVLYQHVYL